MTREQFLDNVSNVEYLEQLAMQTVSPIDDCSWLQTALICRTVANAFKGKGRPYKLEDFMPIKKTSSKEKLMRASKMARPKTK
jgi:hypothetical protein